VRPLAWEIDFLRESVPFSTPHIVTELMEEDLEQIIKSSRALSTEHVRCLVFQLFSFTCTARASCPGT
jgi:hypothetical protein